MKMLSLTGGLLAALVATGASAQSANLTGKYNCIRMCVGDYQPYITQNGTELNMVNEAGLPSRAWPDVFDPMTRIWVDASNQSAVYSPDGVLIQFDNGRVWQRDLGPPPRRRHR